MAEINDSTPGEKALYGKNVRIHTNVTEIPSSSFSEQDSNADQGKTSSSLTSDFLLPCAIIIVPTVVLAILLIFFVFHYEVHPPQFANPALQVPFSETSATHYYVHFATSRISTIVGKFTTAANLATSTALALLAIPIARQIFAHSQKSQHQQLPTPYQLTLLIAVFNNGGFGALFKYLRYQFAFGSQRARIPRLLPVCVTVLTLFILLQYLMVAAETWLSSTMATVNYLAVDQTTPPTFEGGRGLSPFCQQTFAASMVATGDASSEQGQCIVFSEAQTDVSSLRNSSIGYSVVSNSSKVHQLVQYDGFMLPVPASLPSNTDYVAATFALKTTCKPINNVCNVNPVNGSYSCSGGYNLAGSYYSGLSSSQYKHSAYKLQFTDPALSGGVNCSTPNCWNQTNTALKGHFVLQSTIETSELMDNPAWSNDPNALAMGTSGAMLYVLGCDYYAYNVNYSLVNASITDVKIVSPLDLRTFFNLNYPMQAGLGNDFLKYQLTPLVARSASVIEIADGFSAIFSQALLGLSAGVLSGRTALAQQERSSILVAKIPKALLWVNVALPFSFALLGLTILFWALIGHGGEGGKEVKERMSLQGLVAQRYIPVSAHSPKSVDELFKESEKFGADQKVVASWGRHGTWELKASHEL